MPNYPDRSGNNSFGVNLDTLDEDRTASGQYSATAPTLTDGQRSNLQTDAKGSLKVAITGSDGAAVPSAGGALQTVIRGANVVETGQVAVGTGPTALIGARTRTSLIISNHGPAVIYLGVNSVSITNGMALAANTTVELPTSAAVFAVASATGTTAGFFESYIA